MKDYSKHQHELQRMIAQYIEQHMEGEKITTAQLLILNTALDLVPNTFRFNMELPRAAAEAYTKEMVLDLINERQTNVPKQQTDA